MIYDYYCTNCGHKLEGKEIVFDLAQILDLNSGSGENLFIKFSTEDLMELAERNGEVLEDGKKTRLRLSLFDLLGYIAQDFTNSLDQEAMQSLTYEEFEQVTAISNLMKSSGLQNAAVQVKNVRALVDDIIAKLEVEEKTDSEILEEEWTQDTANYSMYFWVLPIFFENTRQIYTIRYSSEVNPPTLMPCSFSGLEIRGYCPKCNQPILKGSGQYEHILVGFLGAQSAGKTSLFVSMINDLPNYFINMGIDLPELLCDGKYEKIKKAIDYNSHGWAVGKTDAKATIETYNASLLVTRKTDKRKVILSFIDIAGELCYDKRTQSISLEALQKFPLITACHLYMLCTCVSQKGYGEADEEAPAIDNVALLNIATGIYEIRRGDEGQLSVPPMALVVTKVDMAVGAHHAGGGAWGRENPVYSNPFAPEQLQELRFHRYRDGDAFNLQAQIEHLKEIYEDASNEDILEALRWCMTTYESKKESNYISFLPCSALGMMGRKFDPERHDFNNDGDSFRPQKLDVVWTWILCNIGMKPVFGKYCLPYIPSYEEGIKIDNASEEAYNVRLVFQADQEQDRTKAVYKLYLSNSELDHELYIHHQGDVEQPTGRNPIAAAMAKRAAATHENERMTILKGYLEKHRSR